VRSYNNYFSKQRVTILNNCCSLLLQYTCIYIYIYIYIIYIIYIYIFYWMQEKTSSSRRSRRQLIKVCSAINVRTWILSCTYICRLPSVTCRNRSVFPRSTSQTSPSLLEHTFLPIERRSRASPRCVQMLPLHPSCCTRHETRHRSSN